MARARQTGGDSKQGVTVILVLFVLLSIILGIMAFLGYSGQSDLERQAKDANEKYAEAARRRDENAIALAAYKVSVGNLNAKEEKEELERIAALKRSYNKTYEDEIKKFKGLKWEPEDPKPDTNYTKLLNEMKIKLEAEQNLRTKGAQEADTEKRKYEQERKAMQDKVAAADKAMQETQALVNKRLDGIDGNYKDVVKKFEESIISAEAYEKKLVQLKKEKEDVEAKLQAALKDAELKLKKIEAQLPTIDLLAYDQPKGKITRIDASTQTAYVNLGTADNIKPQLTFSIFGIGQYKPNAERKGSVEIINVLSDHLSVARVTETKSPTRDPLLTGDLLYNPAWVPGMRDHVAIAGMIDLTGDGRDGTPEFVKNLQKQGVIVDSWLDTRDFSVQGKGMNRQTAYLVLGEVPEFGKQENIREGDARQERKMSINQKMTEIRDEAVRLGVTIVPARRFMALMGYRLPKTPSTADDWNAYTLRPGANKPAAAAGKEGMEGKKEGMEGKKDAMEKKDAKEKMEKKDDK